MSNNVKKIECDRQKELFIETIRSKVGRVRIFNYDKKLVSLAESIPSYCVTKDFFCIDEKDIENGKISCNIDELLCLQSLRPVGQDFNAGFTMICPFGFSDSECKKIKKKCNDILEKISRTERPSAASISKIPIKSTFPGPPSKSSAVSSSSNSTVIYAVVGSILGLIVISAIVIFLIFYYKKKKEQNKQ